MAYNALRQFTAITRYADLARTKEVATSLYGYDQAHRLTSLSHEKDSSVLVDYAWAYDANSRVTSTVNADGTDTFSYDNVGQLTQTDSDYQTDENYAYDANGNRTNTGYSTGTNNQLLSDGTYNYQYDANGNRTRKTTISTGEYVEYAWDHRQRLVSVTFRTSADVKTKQVTYKYDAFDRRIAKDVDDDGDGTFDRGERYVYDGSDIVLVFMDGASVPSRILYGPAIDQPLASEDGSGEVRWMLADNQGTVRDVAEYDAGTDTTSVVNHLQYGSFGNITGQTNSSEEPRHTFTGREWDADAELYYYRARWYDAGVGRFISEDPIGFAGGDENLSRYVHNRAPNFVDPTGLWEDPNGDRTKPAPIVIQLPPDVKATLGLYGQHSGKPLLFMPDPGMLHQMSPQLRYNTLQQMQDAYNPAQYRIVDLNGGAGPAITPGIPPGGSLQTVDGLPYAITPDRWRDLQDAANLGYWTTLGDGFLPFHPDVASWHLEVQAEARLWRTDQFYANGPGWVMGPWPHSVSHWNAMYSWKAHDGARVADGMHRIMAAMALVQISAMVVDHYIAGAAEAMALRAAAAEAQNWTSLGRVVGRYDMVNPGPLPDGLAGTFAGGRYSHIVLETDTEFYRVGTRDIPYGQYFSTDQATSAIQARIDRAIMPVWPDGSTSLIDTQFAIKIPKGTSVYVGQIGTQNGFYVGGAQQVVIPKAWSVPGAEVISTKEVYSSGLLTAPPSYQGLQ